MWFALAIGSAVFFAAQGVAVKRLGGRIDPDVVTWAAFLLALPVYVFGLAVAGLPEVEPGFWQWGGVSLGVNLVAIPLYFRALQAGELSVVLPLSTLSPLFAVFTEYLFFGTWSPGWAFAGVGLLVLGAYLLNAGEIRSGLLGPLRALARDKGARLMLLAAGLWSIAAVADRGAVLASSPLFYLTVFCALFCVAFLPWLVVARRPELRSFVRRPWPLAWVALSGAAMAACQMAAVERALAALVIAVKRLAGLFGVVLGGVLFEERGIATRLVAAGLMAAGAVVLGMVGSP